MPRFTDQYFWNLIFLAFFFGLIFFGTFVLEHGAIKPYETLTFTDYALITLASWRLIRLVVYDKIFAFFREQFFDAVEEEGGMILIKPERGPRRTLADLVTCPWCIGIWMAAMVSFFYLLTPYAFFPVLFLALSAVATFFQLLSSMIGWRAEQLKKEVEGMK
jgi:hypothetical protein